MIDNRCYNCVEENDLRDILSDKYRPPLYHLKEYKGNGIFVCPKCGDVLDLSTKTYVTIVSRKHDNCGELFTEIFDTYSNTKKLTNDEKDSFENDLCGLDICENYQEGLYKFEVVWYYFDCEGYEGIEWDVEIDIISEDELDEKEKKKYQDQLKLREWREYNSDKIHNNLIKEINRGS